MASKSGEGSAISDLQRRAELTSDGPAKGNPQKTAEMVADLVLNLIEDQMAESILHLDRNQVAKIFDGRTSLTGAQADGLMAEFESKGSYRLREEVENDAGSVQALPVVVVRNKSGEVLRLRRREKDEAASLHQKLVIWAGGHVRQEDASSGSAIVAAAQRELQEELRLSVESEELRFIGAVFADAGGRVSKHVALVFEWRAETDDVAVTLSTAEFFERRGISLSGRFVPLDQLAKEVATEEMTEPWSTEIVRQLLPAVPLLEAPRLF